jgi:excisionase family DNA binding protein
MEKVSSTLGQLSQERALKDVNWVAEFLGVSKSWVYQATASGAMPCIRIGAALRFDRATIESWLKGEAAAKSVNLPGCR